MRNSLIILFLFVFLGCSQSKVPTILAQDYNFLMTDGEVTKIRQSNDTLYERDCYVDRPCIKMHYKIIAIHKTGEFTILTLQSLDTIPPGDALCPGKPYSVMALKSITNDQLGYRPPFACLTHYQLDTFQINNPSLDNKHFLTYYSDSYLKELSTLKRVSSKDDIRKIIEAIENNDFNSGKISYSAEELTKACIENGYNPVGAGITIDSFWRTK
jgi:hypothetical protein